MSSLTPGGTTGLSPTKLFKMIIEEANKSMKDWHIMSMLTPFSRMRLEVNITDMTKEFPKTPNTPIAT